MRICEKGCRELRHIGPCHAQSAPLTPEPAPTVNGAPPTRVPSCPPTMQSLREAHAAPPSERVLRVDEQAEAMAEPIAASAQYLEQLEHEDTAHVWEQLGRAIERVGVAATPALRPLTDLLRHVYALAERARQAAQVADELAAEAEDRADEARADRQILLDLLDLTEQEFDSARAWLELNGREAFRRLRLRSA